MKSLLAESRKTEYGDWQTNLSLAVAVCEHLKAKGLRPQVVIEPTCGIGNFILAALLTFDGIEDVYGIEITKPYLDRLRETLERTPNITAKTQIHLLNQSIFDADLASIKKSFRGKNVLALGNPPWVTNSKLGELDSPNLPQKSNIKRAKGIDAITGKGNFDIAEFICLQMAELLAGEKAHMAFLLKNSVVRNLVQAQKDAVHPLADMEQLSIDAQKEFGVAVAASLFCAKISRQAGTTCFCRDFHTGDNQSEYGWIDEKFVSDIHGYASNRTIDGQSPFMWRSGVKHDCSQVMELEKTGDGYINGLGEIVDIEPAAVFPLLKSSDIKEKEISRIRKSVILTQHFSSEDTSSLKTRFPKLFAYLMRHAPLLDGRKSTIYRNRPRFCMFGIGPYTFGKYKVVVSGLYKHARFALASEIDGKCVIPDDTCYFLGFDNYDRAKLVLEILNSRHVQNFIKSVYFPDAKRAITKDLLMRIDLQAALRLMKEESVVQEKNVACLMETFSEQAEHVQLSLF